MRGPSIANLPEIVLNQGMILWRPLVLGLALAGAATAGPAPAEVALRAQVAAGPKLRVAAVVNFGGAGTEHFAGVLSRPNGEILAFGNSWGPPFPGTATVLGADMAREVPLFSGGTPTDESPLEVLPAAEHPNRTGFLVAYGPGLKSVTGVTRFGWGVATVDAAVLLPDGGLVTAGLARAGFGAVAEKTGKLKRLPGRGATGSDVYVARWREDLKGLAWVWVLEQHGTAPARLYSGSDGRVVFDCGGVKTISADGATLAPIELPVARANEERFLRGVNPKSGALLLAGWTQARKPDWFGPLVEERAGARATRFYDWPVSLAWQPTLELTAAAGITQAEYLPDGRVLLGAPMQRGRSVLERHPWDLTLPAKGRGLIAEELANHANRPVYGATAHCRLAQFDPQQPGDCLFATWTGVSAEASDRASEELTLDGLRPVGSDFIAVWGMSGGALLGTVATKPVAAGMEAVAKWKQKPLTPYLTVFGKDFAGVRWSGLLPRGTVSGVARAARGVVVAGWQRPAWKHELYELLPGTPAFGGGLADGQLLWLEETP